MKILRFIGRLLAIFGYLLFLVLVIVCILQFSMKQKISGVLDDNWIILLLSILFMIIGKIIEVKANKKIVTEEKTVVVNKGITKDQIGIYLCMVPSGIYLFLMMIMTIYRMTGICVAYCIDTVMSRSITFTILALSLLLIFVQVKRKNRINLKYKRDLRLLGFLIIAVSIFMIVSKILINIYIIVGIIDGVLLVLLGVLKGKNKK